MWLGQDVVNEVNEWVIAEEAKAQDDSDEDPPESKSPGETDAGDQSQDTEKHYGNLLIDATCAPADIKYPMDVNILNEGREKLEHIIDVLHAQHRRGHAQAAHIPAKRAMAIAKQRRPKSRKILKNRRPVAPLCQTLSGHHRRSCREDTIDPIEPAEIQTSACHH